MQAHPNADKLLVLQIDVGGEKRQICAGMSEHYQPEQLVGKQIIVVANLEPRACAAKSARGCFWRRPDSANRVKWWHLAAARSKRYPERSKVTVPMLRELHISNLAVIADVRIELHAG